MRVEWRLFVAWFIGFYLLVNFSFALPNEYNGQSLTVLLRNSSRGYQWQIIDISLSFLFALGPYLVLVRLFPRKKFLCITFIILSMTIAYLFRFYVESS